VVSNRSSEEPISGFFVTRDFADENMLLGLDYTTLKTAGFSLFPIESYSKSN
jgi:hypothetical protein